MKNETLINRLLSDEETFKKDVLDNFLSKGITRDEAISRLNVSKRHFRRLVRSYKINGVIGIIHGLKGKHSNYHPNRELRDKVLELYKLKYKDFSYVFACEKLMQLDHIEIHWTTLRNWLLKAGIAKSRHKRKAYFKYREPRSKFGSLVQADGSFHDWFGDGRMLCLIHFVDDATKTSLAMLWEGETTIGCLTVLKKWCELYGAPEQLYTDKDSVYRVNNKNQKPTLEEQLQGQGEGLTEFGKVCRKLKIKLIFANTAQAKGRVERRHALFQDRFVKELALNKVKTIAGANTFLLKPGGFLEQINSQFTIKPKNSSSACIRMSQAELDSIFTIDNLRTVRNDYTIQYKNVVYQLSKNSCINASNKVTVKEDLQGSITIFARKTKLDYTVITNYSRPKPEIKRKPTTGLTRSMLSKKNKKRSFWSNYCPGYLSSNK